MFTDVRTQLQEELSALRDAGLYKTERYITTPQSAEIVTGGQEVLNFCANNYLGLSNNAGIMRAAQDAIAQYGFGLSSVRFICGTQDLHKALERAIADYVGAEDAILYAAAFDANGGVFEPLLTEQDAVVSDELNHASIIDGIRLCKAKRFRYRNNDPNDLEAQLKAARTEGARRILVVTDGVFSMDGVVANLSEIAALTDQYGAMLMIDECHATGFMGPQGRGTHFLHGVQDRVDIVTGTFGKALGGAMGGFTAGRKEIVDLLRQKSRPYLFSNTLAPAVAGGSLKAIEIAQHGDALRDRLWANTEQFRRGMTEAGFDIRPGTHPIVPVMLGDATKAQDYSRELLAEGIYAIGFFFPVVPRGKARIRIQLSAAHTEAHVERAIQAFIQVRERVG